MDYHTLHHTMRADLTIPEIISRTAFITHAKAGLCISTRRFTSTFSTTPAYFQNIQQLYTQLQMRKPDWHKLLALALRGDSLMEHFTQELFNRRNPNDRNFCDRPAKPL